MIVKGKLIATSDSERLVRAITVEAAQAVYLGDPLSAPQEINFIKAASLVPSYRELTFYVDGNKQRYEAEYNKMLTQKMAVEMFASIIGSLYAGRNVVLYFPPEVKEMNYSELLLVHLMINYGITAESPQTQFMYDPSYDMVNAQLLFAYNIMTGVDYVLAVDTLDDATIAKLRPELCEKWHIPITADNKTFVDMVGFKKQYGIGTPIPVFTKKPEPTEIEIPVNGEEV